MKDREKKYSEDLERCRENIRKTKGLIEYHKDMLKKLEKKEAAISGKLDKEKMSSLMALINKGGYDIDNLRKAVGEGDFSGISNAKANTENPVEIPNMEKSVENIGDTPNVEYNVEVSDNAPYMEYGSGNYTDNANENENNENLN